MKEDFLDISLFKEYLKGLKTRKGKGLSKSSIATYYTAIQSFIATNPEIDDPTSYIQFLEHHARRKKGRYYYAALKHWLNYKFSDDKQLRDKIIAAFPTEIIHEPTRKNLQITEGKRIKVITDMKTMKSKILALIQKSTGFRIGDVLSIKIGDIYYEPHPRFGWVLKIDTIGKGDKQYVGYIFSPLEIQLIAKYCNIRHPDTEIKKGNVIEQAVAERKGKPALFDELDSDPTVDYYFMESFGLNPQDPVKVRKSNYDKYYKELKEACAKNGIHPNEFATHSFRKNLATEYYQQHKDIVKVKKLLNHSNIQTTLAYIEQTSTENIFEELAEARLGHMTNTQP